MKAKEPTRDKVFAAFNQLLIVLTETAETSAKRGEPKEVRSWINLLSQVRYIYENVAVLLKRQKGGGK